ncbi:hypothetical protein BCV70DRAFT_203216 [Testicularia cyperi]|uniref:UBX domain-containing protein n=1 Tax=Testicularia cyperi TaxID=1882483 RepID=A0A317XFK2_9BASI|nr:hypothetical protein BCV70DRAFT_203216 [Testicularia cyperi]
MSSSSSSSNNNSAEAGPSSARHAEANAAVRVFRPPPASNSSTLSGSASASASASASRSSASTSTSAMAMAPALGDEEEELKPTPDELKQAFRSTISGRHGPDAPLLTRALREREEQRLFSSRTKTWENVRIRIRFSDRTMIESTFTEHDTIEAVYRFLDSCLDTAATKGSAVTIYTSPPKTEYSRSDPRLKAKTLRQLGLIPSAVVSLRWQDPHMNANSFPAPLKPELGAKAQDLPLPPSFEPNPTTATATATATATTPASSSSKPVPKWLKNIVKK